VREKVGRVHRASMASFKEPLLILDCFKVSERRTKKIHPRQNHAQTDFVLSLSNPQSPKKTSEFEKKMIHVESQGTK
jgi:hypothetical protein